MTPNPHSPNLAAPSDARSEAALTRALSHAPSPAIPADFASRVRHALPLQPAARPRRSFSYTAGLIAATIIAAALFALAPHAAPSFTSFSFCIELLLLAQLGGIAWWLASDRNLNR